MSSEALSRRRFLRTLGWCSAGAGGLATLGTGASLLLQKWRPELGSVLLEEALADSALERLARAAPRARYWISAAKADSSCTTCHPPGEVDISSPHAHEQGAVKCLLCARGCLIGVGERGMCHARMNVGGELRSLVYGRPITTHVDPIEKKPFYHYLPGSSAYSLATSGCPLRCKFCQNWQISQARPEDYEAARRSPESLARAGKSKGCGIIAYTYNEPTVFAEYLLDAAGAAAERGLRNVLISCGYMQEAPLSDMCEVLDAIKIDLKGIDPGFYRDVCGAELAPVLRSIEQVAKSGRHLEIVNLVVPSLNDSERDFAKLARWLLNEVGPDVPLHFTRFHPDYKLPNLPPTPVATLSRAREMAMAAGLRYVFVGNVPGHPGNHTYCPGCGKVVIERRGFFVAKTQMREGRCAACKTPIAGVWS